MNALRKDDSGSTVPNTSEKKKLFSTHVTFLVLDTFLLHVAIL